MEEVTNLKESCFLRKTSPPLGVFYELGSKFSFSFPLMTAFPSFRRTLGLIAGIGSIAAAHAAPNFEKDIFPILSTKCLDCHSAPREVNGKLKKPKAGLRLDAAWAIQKGGESGAVLTPGDAEKSALYEVVTLPPEDDFFMPPKGNPLTQAEIALLKDWIQAGANFGTWVGDLTGAPAEILAKNATAKPIAPTKRLHEEWYQSLAADLPPATDEALLKARQTGAQIITLKADLPLLRMDFLTRVSACDDAKLTAALQPLKQHLAQLDLSRTVITDAGLAQLAECPRLTSLDLRQTAVSDAGLTALHSLKKLRRINLYGTRVTTAGISQLRSALPEAEITAP
jgi:Planctomycete cytochrome C/Leucine Rich repeat